MIPDKSIGQAKVCAFDTDENSFLIEKTIKSHKKSYNIKFASYHFDQICWILQTNSISLRAHRLFSDI